MLDPVIIGLTNQIAREGINDEASKKLITLFDTVLIIEDFSTMNLVNLQTLLLVLQDFDIKHNVKRLVDEVRYRIIRQSLGTNWLHGIRVQSYNIYEMNRNLMTQSAVVTIYEDGYANKDIVESIQPPLPKAMWLLNDFGAAALNN